MPTAALRTSPAAPLVGTTERARRRLVGAVMLIYLLAIFEGSLRKYALPQFGQYIFFIRDPILLYAYLLATRHRLWPRGSAMFRCCLAAAAIGIALLLLQMAFGAPSDLRLLLGAYGWRAYFFYVPLAFLVGAQFSRSDILRLARVTLALAVPIAVLVTVQFFSPPGAKVNVGVAEEQELMFKDLSLSVEHTRPAGPFTSNVGQQQFVATTFAILLACVLLPAGRRQVSIALLLPATLSLLTCVALSGSRGTVLQCVLIGLCALSLSLLGRGAVLKARAATLPGLLAVAAIVLYPVVFPEGFSAFVTRWNSAAATEAGFQGGVIGRALYGFVDFLRLVDQVPLLGYGLGFGGNASILLQATVDGVMPGRLVETDYARHMVDLGAFLGCLYIGWRLALALWLGARVLRATRRAADPLPFMLFSFAGYVLIIGQLTGNGSINVYGWLFTGLCIAACRAAEGPASATTPTLRRPTGRARR